MRKLWYVPVHTSSVRPGSLTQHVPGDTYPVRNKIWINFYIRQWTFNNARTNTMVTSCQKNARHVFMLASDQYKKVCQARCSTAGYVWTTWYRKTSRPAVALIQTSVWIPHSQFFTVNGYVYVRASTTCKKILALFLNVCFGKGCLFFATLYFVEKGLKKRKCHTMGNLPTTYHKILT